MFKGTFYLPIYKKYTFAKDIYKKTYWVLDSYKYVAWFLYRLGVYFRVYHMTHEEGGIATPYCKIYLMVGYKQLFYIT